MAKKDHSKSITKVSPKLDVPDFMSGEEITGLEDLKQFVVPPFIKMIQKSAGEELLQDFGAGDVILSPSNAAVVEMARGPKGQPLDGEKTSFQFVPIFFYPEWVTWNPIELKGTENSIRYRTIDSNDPIVAKAKSQKLRTELHPTNPELKIRHIEHLNFIIILHNHPLGNEPCILSFSRGEWKAGSKFAGLIKMRKAPLYGCVFEGVVGHRSNDKGDWYGLDIVNPEENPWVDKDNYETFRALHQEFEKHHSESRLQAQYDSVPKEADEAATKASDEF